MPYRSFRYLAAAWVALTEFIVRPYILPVLYMNCHSPVAPTRLTALGFRADSITAIYFSSTGSP